MKSFPVALGPVCLHPELGATSLGAVLSSAARRPPSLFHLPVSGSAGVSAGLGRIVGGPPRATARPPASSGSGAGSLLGSGWRWCCGLPACPPRRSARSRKMSWMRKEVSRLDCEGGAAQGLRPLASTRASRGSAALSIPPLLRAAFAVLRPRALIAAGSAAPPAHWPRGHGCTPIGCRGLQVTVKKPVRSPGGSRVLPCCSFRLPRFLSHQELLKPFPQAVPNLTVIAMWKT